LLSSGFVANLQTILLLKRSDIMDQFVILPTNDAGLIFLEGWESQPEGTGDISYRWSTDVTANIKIPIIHRVNTSKAYKLILEAIPYNNPNNPGYQDVAVYLDGAFLAQVRLLESGYVETQVHLPPYNPTSLNSSSILSFVIPNSGVPQKQGISTDQRRLGIGLRRLELQRIN
jgi:hypothetical protein